MSDSTQRMASDIDQMTEVAMLYYLENVTQEAIAKRFDLSRAKVSRLLKRARDEGIVEVRVLQHPAMNNELERALVERFKLDRALIAWEEVFIGGTTAIAAALSAGLAVAAFPRRLAPADTLDIGDALGLPPLPSLSIVLHSSLSDPRTKDTLRAITAAFREHRAPSSRPVALRA